MVTLRLWLLLSAAVAGACIGSRDASTGAASPGPARRSSARPATPTNDTLDLAAMLVPVPEYAGQGRNLFTYGPVRSEAPPPPPPPPPPIERPVPVPTPPVNRPTTPQLRVDMNYAGFLEKTNPDGEKTRYAIFISRDGTEIFAGAEGETVANRFKVVEIGLESVTVSAPESGVTQRIPLAVN